MVSLGHVQVNKVVEGTRCSRIIPRFMRGTGTSMRRQWRPCHQLVAVRWRPPPPERRHLKFASCGVIKNPESVSPACRACSCTRARQTGPLPVAHAYSWASTGKSSMSEVNAREVNETAAAATRLVSPCYRPHIRNPPGSRMVLSFGVYCLILLVKPGSAPSIDGGTC